jgi:hypothetical protein
MFFLLVIICVLQLLYWPPNPLQIVNFGPHAVNLTIHAHQLRATVDARGSRVTVLTSSDVKDENSFRNPRNVRGWLLFTSFFSPYCYHFYTNSESVNWNMACQWSIFLIFELHTYTLASHLAMSRRLEWICRIGHVTCNKQRTILMWQQAHLTLNLQKYAGGAGYQSVA